MNTIIKRTLLCILIAGLAGFAIQASAPGNEDIEIAYQNAKKASVWGLNNMRIRKPKSENKIIEKDALLAIVKIEKEINGVKVYARGFSGTTEVCITAFRSYETLLKEGYIDKNNMPLTDEE